MAKKAYTIKVITKDDVYSLGEKEKAVWQVVEDLAERNHIKMPEVGIYEDKDPNAFAT
jgi:Zn-dependent protease with chaperone function